MARNKRIQGSNASGIKPPTPYPASPRQGQKWPLTKSYEFAAAEGLHDRRPGAQEVPLDVAAEPRRQRRRAR